MRSDDARLQAALAARDLDGVIERLAELLAMPPDHDQWVLDMLCDRIPADVDDDSRARIREQLRDRLPAFASERNTRHA